jgi:hypothetical protein
MVKLSNMKIEKTDIEAYLNNYSDFSFEIKVLQKLNSLGFSCEHSGTYEDPITRKTREFDIRAKKLCEKKDKESSNFCLAVECKNLRENFPLVVHCLPRTKAESYQNVVYSHTSYKSVPFHQYGFKLNLDHEDSFYKVGKPVGKSCDQVGKTKSQSNELIGLDSNVFEKISQSINSTYDLMRAAHYAGNGDITVYSFILPILVVPKNRLWTVTYDFDGEIVDGPKTVSHVSYYIDKSWKFGGNGNELAERYFLSHLEIVELDNLEQLLSNHNIENRFSLQKMSGYMSRHLSCRPL